MTATLEHVDDRELMRAHVAGDPHAFGEIFRRHKDRMWAVALRTCGNPQMAEDAVQEAFISAFRRAASYRGDSAVTTWLHRIVVNASLDRLRRTKPTDELPEGERGMPPAPDAHASAEVRLDIQQALDQLPEAQKAALVLVDMYAVPVAEAAQILDCAEGTVKSRCARGRAALAQILGVARGERQQRPVEPGHVPRPAGQHRGDHPSGTQP